MSWSISITYSQEKGIVGSEHWTEMSKEDRLRQYDSGIVKDCISSCSKESEIVTELEETHYQCR